MVSVANAQASKITSERPFSLYHADYLSISPEDDEIVQAPKVLSCCGSIDCEQLCTKCGDTAATDFGSIYMQNMRARYLFKDIVPHSVPSQTIPAYDFLMVSGKYWSQKVGPAFKRFFGAEWRWCGCWVG
jgi:hypothetical protein